MNPDDIGRAYTIHSHSHTATAILIDFNSPARLDTTHWPESIAAHIQADRRIDTAALLIYATDDGASDTIAALHRADGWTDLTGQPLAITRATD